MLLHVVRCAACRAALDDWVVIRALAANATLPPVEPDPSAYEELRTQLMRRLIQQEQELARPDHRVFRRLLTAATVLALVFGGGLLTHRRVFPAPDDLLSQAHAREGQPRDESVQRVRFTLAPAAFQSLPAKDGFMLLRDLRLRPVERSAAVPASIPTRLADALTAYGFDWQHPLSVSPVRAWRAAYPASTARVSLRGSEFLYLRALAREAVPQAIELLVRADGLAVARQALVFEGIGRFEVEEVAVLTNDEIDRPLVTTATAVERDAEALDVAELDARLVLRATELDLDPRIAVARADGVLTVSGAANASARRTAVQQLSGLPLVRTNIQVVGSSDAAAGAALKVGPGMQQWLDGAYHEAAARAQFVAEVDALAARIPRRLTALRALALRYPEREVSRLSGPARAKLLTLTSRHYRELRADLTGLRRRLAGPFLTTSTQPAPTKVPSDWRSRVARATPHAVAFDRELRIVVRDARDLGAPLALNEAFDRLWSVALAAPAGAEQQRTARPPLDAQE